LVYSRKYELLKYGIFSELMIQLEIRLLINAYITTLYRSITYENVSIIVSHTIY
jgi:hypothetical protein